MSMSSDRVWTTEQEINLFSLVCDFKPAGADKNKNLSEILTRINSNIASGDAFTADQIWAKLRHFYNLERIEDIEKDSEDDLDELRERSPRKEERARSNIRAKSKDMSTSESTIEKSRTPEATDNDREEKSPQKTGDITEMYSSELSDVEGEETELEKLHDKELSLAPPKEAKRRGRPKKIIKKAQAKEAFGKEAQNPAPKKRLRPAVKEGELEVAQRKRPTSTQRTKQKLKADRTPETEYALHHSTPTNASISGIRDDVKTESAESSGDTETQTTNDPEHSTNGPGDNAKNTESSGEEPKTRRSKRQAVRRSTRNK